MCPGSSPQPHSGHAEATRRTVEIRQVRQGRSLEAFDLNVWTKKQTLLRLMFSAEWREAAVWNGEVHTAAAYVVGGSRVDVRTS